MNSVLKTGALCMGVVALAACDPAARAQSGAGTGYISSTGGQEGAAPTAAAAGENIEVAQSAYMFDPRTGRYVLQRPAQRRYAPQDSGQVYHPVVPQQRYRPTAPQSSEQTYHPVVPQQPQQAYRPVAPQQQPQQAYRPVAPQQQPQQAYRPAAPQQQPQQPYRPAAPQQQPQQAYRPAAPQQQPQQAYRPAAPQQQRPAAPRLSPRSRAAMSRPVAPAAAPQPPISSRPVYNPRDAAAPISVGVNSNISGGLGLNTASIYSRTEDPNAALPPRIEFNIAHLPQEEPLWCWAAAAQQAVGWVNGGRAPAQCAIVAMAHDLSVEECCADREGICAKTGEIPAIAALVRKFGGLAEEIATPRDPRTIYEQLNRGRTMLIRLRPAPHDQAVGIRHMIVIRGIEWLRLPNGKLQATLLYNDPLGEDQRQVNFEEIVDFFEEAMLLSRL